MVRVFAAGGIILDTVVAADGTLGPLTMGGNAVYSAAGARLWLDDVGIVGRVPANYPPAHLGRLSAAGIDLVGVRHEAETVEEGEWFFYRPDGSRRDHLHAPLADPLPAPTGTRLTPDAVADLERVLAARSSGGTTFAAFRRRHPVRLADVPDGWLGARGVHLAANPVAEQRVMADGLASEGRIVTLDPGSNAADLRHDVAGLLNRLGCFLPSEKELAELVPTVAPAAALQTLSALGPALLIAKLGAQGSLVQEPDGRPVAVPAVRVPAIDPTGAGDAFCGGVLAGLVLTGDPILAACLGTVSASFAVEAFGPFHLAETSCDAARARLLTLVERLDPRLSGRLRAPLARLDPA
ncbi:PfkB family carbohydrate kinase [Aureimonas sp. ME7]|uniref:carbohydrate kinase family protein n=1 Tax=Aureimonas sp. ME7 TaxID=2744252 RepID=UPI0015F7D442|nr:PfkB family carbohydrate kinase [Aureimonas sp. ME7]